MTNSENDSVDVPLEVLLEGETNRALTDLEALLHEDSEPLLEAQLSVNEWVGRIRSAAQEAHLLARTGEPEMEAQSWLQISAIALRRAAHVRAAVS